MLFPRIGEHVMVLSTYANMPLHNALSKSFKIYKCISNLINLVHLLIDSQHAAFEIKCYVTHTKCEPKEKKRIFQHISKSLKISQNLSKSDQNLSKSLKISQLHKNTHNPTKFVTKKISKNIKKSQKILKISKSLKISQNLSKSLKISLNYIKTHTIPQNL
jgi:predicted transcriptional regulator